MPKRKGCNTQRRVARCAPPVAVRLDIRPRLRLAPDWQPRASARRRWLPPLAVPAAAYWVAMAALTYAFAHWRAYPLDEALASAPAPSPPSAPDFPVEPPSAPPPSEPATEVSPPTQAAPLVASNEREPEREPEPPPPLVAMAPAPAFTGEREPRAERPSSTLDSAPIAPPSLPEFTDSTRPAKREHAADGPRIDTLFETGDVRPEPPPAPTPPAETEPNAPLTFSSCEAAIARNNEQLEIGARRGPADITREAYAGILQNGSYLAACSIPERTVFEICAAVKNGHAVGITVSSSPASAPLNACVRRAVARLKFPRSERLDVTHTRFEPTVR